MAQESSYWDGVMWRAIFLTQAALHGRGWFEAQQIAPGSGLALQQILMMERGHAEAVAESHATRERGGLRQS